MRVLVVVWLAALVSAQEVALIPEQQGSNVAQAASSNTSTKADSASTLNAQELVQGSLAFDCRSVNPMNARAVCGRYCASLDEIQGTSTPPDQISITLPIMAPPCSFEQVIDGTCRTKPNEIEDYCCSCDLFGCLRSDESDKSECKPGAVCVLCGTNHLTNAASAQHAVGVVMLSIILSWWTTAF
eukprot:c21463_g1_i1.p1 GENE.c21463_g1_i1~~c21463_g1_i1.p1  ORF type:complete len:185 (-),score=23.04 c21463_g1_i1:42-596(-)